VNENDFQHLPQDLQDIAHALAAHRDSPDGHLLERVLARVKASPRPKRGFRGFFRARLAALSMLLLCLGLNVSGALAAVLSSVGLSTASANSLNLSTLFSSLTNTVSTGHNSQSAADEVYCPEGGKGGSDDNGQNGGSEKNGGSEQNMSPQVNVVQSAPTYTKNNKGVIISTTYTKTTTTTTHNDSETNGGSESNGGNGQCTPCPPSTGSGSEKNGGSENVKTETDTYVNGKMTTANTSNTTKDGDSGGSEQNGGQGCPSPPPEKPGCGNEQNMGISGNSGDHGGQPPKQEERGQCPKDPGVDGN
jgi:hypothetical protein